MVKREASEVNNSVHADFLRKYLVDKEKSCNFAHKRSLKS